MRARIVFSRRTAGPAFIAAALAVGTFAGPALATPSPAPTPAFHLVKQADGSYTIPLHELLHSGTTGKVVLQPNGPKTIVRVYVFGNSKHKHAFNLHSGRDCVESGAATAVPLRPALPGQMSQTIVSVPISDFKSKDYWVDVRNATARSQFAEACANLH